MIFLFCSVVWWGVEVRLKTARLCKCVCMCALGQKGVKCICICMKEIAWRMGTKLIKNKKNRIDDKAHPHLRCKVIQSQKRHKFPAQHNLHH